jgi:hypothetical protein
MQGGGDMTIPTQAIVSIKVLTAPGRKTKSR